MKKVKSKLSTFMQNFVVMGLLMLLTLLLCFTISPFEKTQPKTIDAVSIIPDPAMYEWNQDDRGWYTYLGTYPQTYVGDELNSELVDLLNDGNLTPTGNTYMSNDYDFLEYENKTRQNQEYIYKGKLYVANKNQSFYEEGIVESSHFSTGDSLGNRGDIQFFKVEPIKWYIIDGTDPETAPAGTQCRVISDLALNPFWFNETRSDGNVWQDSLIRQYLKDNFYYETGLNDLECIIQQHNQNNVTGNYTDGSGPATDDYVYLLSYQEMNGQYEFLDINEERKTTPTDFALSNGSYYMEGGTFYWLRSAGSFDGGGCLLAYTGEPIHGADIVGVDGFLFCIRPALTLDLDSMPEPGEVEPIYISTADELKQLSDYSAAGGIFNPKWKFYLTNDIDMSSVQNFAIGGNNPFTGYFNGQGHTISNLNLSSSTGQAGMFATAENCKIVNLKIKDDRMPAPELTIAGALIGNCSGNVMIDNVMVEYAGMAGGYCGGLIGTGAKMQQASFLNLVVTNCTIYVGEVACYAFGGVISMASTYNYDYANIDVSACTIMIGKVIDPTVNQAVASGVMYGFMQSKEKVPISISLNQIYCEFRDVDISDRGGGVIGLLAAAPNGSLTYSEVAVSANVTNGDFVYETGSADSLNIIGSNSYFNIVGGNIISRLSGTGYYAGVFDVARKQYYSGFSDNQWLIFPTDKHPTIREFMAVGDFATVQSVEDKLIELGYTKIM